MIRLPRLGSASIFTRTFLMMLVALLVAAGIGLMLMILRSPVHDVPASVPQVAELLKPGIRDAPRDSHGPGGPPGDSRGPGSGPGEPPPGGPRGPGGGFVPTPWRSPGLPPDSGLRVRQSPSPPSPPPHYDAVASASLLQQLAQRMGVTASSLRVYVTDDRSGGPPGPPDAGDLARADSFVAAWQVSDRVWRIVESPNRRFADELGTQVLLLFGLGLLVLMPMAWLFARALSAPIRRFAEAAKRLGNDTGAPPLAREGPAEMLLAVDAFNAMQSRLNRLIHERMHMIGAIAHDLRTPLTRLSFRLDGLPSPLNEKVEADIHEMKAMISAALDFVRDRSLGVYRQRLDFRLLVESVVDDLTDVGHDVTLQTGPPITLEGDPLALRRMVMNLVDNALKYGERARLRLRTSNEECTLEVDDDGPGIPESVQQQVLEPFFRFEGSRNRDTGGIGLGLTTVHAIVLDHGGGIALRNRKDGGLRVIVTLPTGGA